MLHLTSLTGNSIGPLTFRCRVGLHERGAVWPNPTCCSYMDSLLSEERWTSKLMAKTAVPRDWKKASLVSNRIDDDDDEWLIYVCSPI